MATIATSKAVLATVKKVDECFNPNTPPPLIKSMNPIIMRIIAKTIPAQVIKLRSFMIILFVNNVSSCNMIKSTCYYM